MHERSVSASLSNIEALALPNRKISDVHAISANNHNHQHFGLEKKFARFLCSPNNCYCRYCLTLNVAPRRRYGLRQADERGLPLIRIRALCGVQVQSYEELLEQARKKRSFFLKTSLYVVLNLGDRLRYVS